MSKTRLILGIDLEGINKDLVFQGVNLKTDRISEIGAVLWDWQDKQPVKIFSKIIDEKNRLKISDELEQLTGLNDRILHEYGLHGEEITTALKELSALMDNADYLMAHNGLNYDLPMLKALFERHNLQWPNKIWIDTLNDIEYPKTFKSKSLAMLEYSHGFINPFPHRAITDVLSMLKIASHYSLERMVKLATSDKVKIVAKLDAPNWKNKAEVEQFNFTKNKVAKSGFRWDPYEKKWSCIIPQVYIDENKIKYDFEWFISKE